MLLLLSIAIAGDHWLEIDSGPSPLEMRYKVGDHLTKVEPVKARKDSLSRFELVSAAGARDISAAARTVTDPIALIDLLPSELGTLMTVLDTAPTVVETAWAAWEQGAYEEGFETGPQAATVKDRQGHHIKHYFANGEGGGAWTTAAVGQELEIVPDRDPSAARLKDTVSVKVLFKGKPLSNARIMGASRRNSVVMSASTRTDPSGGAAFPIDRNGDWIIRVAVREKSSEPGADWRTWYAAMTFWVPAATPPAQ